VNEIWPSGLVTGSTSFRSPAACDAMSESTKRADVLAAPTWVSPRSAAARANCATDTPRSRGQAGGVRIARYRSTACLMSVPSAKAGSPVSVTRYRPWRSTRSYRDCDGVGQRRFQHFDTDNPDAADTSSDTDRVVGLGHGLRAASGLEFPVDGHGDVVEQHNTKCDEPGNLAVVESGCRDGE